VIIFFENVHLMTLKRLFYKLVSTTPTRELTWSPEDFEMGRKWAKSLPHPHSDDSDLWEYLKNRDSVEILDCLNQKIRSLDNLE
jgi:hypothetical protein